MKQEIVMICGFPSSGKSRLAAKFVDTHEILNRDSVGGKVFELLPRMETLLNEGKSVVLDNLHPTIKNRKPFIKAAHKRKVPIRCEWQNTPLEQCQIQALNRMWERYGTIFWTKKEIDHHAKAKKDPNIFPVVVLFKYRKEFEKPTLEEGFVSVTKSKPVFEWPKEYTNKAVFLDYDDTLRTVVNGKQKYPTCVEEIEILPNRTERLKDLKEKGYLLLGVSNQSGIARGDVSYEDVVQCFKKTNELLGVEIDFYFCPHRVPPSCYCRKPQSGIGVYLINKYKLDPAQCIFVGDQTTDRTFAERCGFQFVFAKDYFSDRF